MLCGLKLVMVYVSVATLDLRFLPTAQAISTYFHLRMSDSTHNSLYFWKYTHVSTYARAFFKEQFSEEIQ